MTQGKVLRVLLLSFVILLLGVGSAHAVIVSDDFSAPNHDDWQLMGSQGSAPPSTPWSVYTDGHLLLAAPYQNAWVRAWFRPGEPNPFVARFDYKIGGGTGGEGLVFMFYKNTDYFPNPSTQLCFQPYGVPASGYGIEFDGKPYASEGGGPGPHVALIKDTVGNHLVNAPDTRVSDDEWHEAQVTVGESSITVDIDGDRVIEWNGPIDRTYQGLGFGAASGALTNAHWIDNFYLEDPTPIATLGGTSVVAYGAKPVLTGRLADDADAGLGARSLDVLRSQNYSGAIWVKVGTTTTRGDGSFSYAPPASFTSSRYRVRYNGDDNALGPAHFSTLSNVKVVQVRASVGRPTGYPKRGRKSKTYTVYGSIKARQIATPASYGTVVIGCYRRQSGVYVLRRIVRASVYDYRTYSRYKGRVKLPHRGKWLLVAYFTSTETNAASISRYRYVSVR